jgi:hypothetical protein
VSTKADRKAGGGLDARISAWEAIAAPGGGGSRVDPRRIRVGGSTFIKPGSKNPRKGWRYVR